MWIRSSWLIVKVLFSLFIRPFRRLMFHFSTRTAAISCIISTTCPHSNRIILISLDVPWMSIAFWLFWITFLSLPIRNLWVSNIVLSTEPIWIRRDSRICSTLRIDFSMIHTELWRSIFRSSLMIPFSTPRGIPGRSTTGPTLRPKSHPRAKLIYSWMECTSALIILILSELHSTSMMSAYHDSFLIVISFSILGLLFVCVRYSCWVFMHTFIVLSFRELTLFFLLSNSYFMRISILKC